eukprot:gnl/TRDRNA2_/TRDRNA2_203101_c0_seq1.p1 gnl/TRDRNA2_/TRDRNA2_203101_c0~~gnl/TRDRNA2_/TRDRNA2_203101_c0_seq1.p1  ORF type:complete len:129 (-),score=6.49 gnl/TRDRNA2_/TRDRNA2_203101_c0_seq1:10-396(-)
MKSMKKVKQMKQMNKMPNRHLLQLLGLAYSQEGTSRLGLASIPSSHKCTTITAAETLESIGRYHKCVVPCKSVRCPLATIGANWEAVLIIIVHCLFRRHLHATAPWTRTYRPHRKHIACTNAGRILLP